MNERSESRAGPRRVAQQRQPVVGDLDPRLLEAAPRMVLNAVAAEHDAGPGGSCPACGWPIAGGQRACPSRVLARCVADRKPVPAWLVALVGAVPGARAREVREPVSLRQAMQDAMPGLFDAPARIEPTDPDLAQPPVVGGSKEGWR